MTELTENSKPAAARVGECGPNTDSGVVTSPELLLHPLIELQCHSFCEGELCQGGLAREGSRHFTHLVPARTQFTRGPTHPPSLMQIGRQDKTICMIAVDDIQQNTCF